MTLPRQVAPEPKELGRVLTVCMGSRAAPGYWRWRRSASAGSGWLKPIVDMLRSPVAKAVLAGIAAMVVKRAMAPRA